MATRFRQETRAALRRAVGRLMHRDRFLYGTVLASPEPTTTTFALSAAKRYPDDHFNGAVVYSVSGTGSGQSSSTADFAGGSGIFSLAPAVSPAFDDTTVVEVWPEGSSPDEVNDALNRAIGDAEELVHVRTDVTSPVIAVSRRVITLPAGFTELIDVGHLDDGGNWVAYPPARYAEHLSEAGKGFTLRGSSIYLSTEIGSHIPDSDVMVRGYRLPTRLDDDADLCEVNGTFLTYYAAFLLESGDIAGAQLDPENHVGRATGWLRAALQIRERMQTDWEPNTQRVEV